MNLPPIEWRNGSCSETVLHTWRVADDNDHSASLRALIKTRRHTRIRSALEWYGNLDMTILLVEQEIPTNYKEALVGPESEIWLVAMNPK
jgi:hypothetical protein